MVKPETPAAILAEYNRIWAIQAETPRGPDPAGIIRIVAAQFKVTEAHVRSVLLDDTGMWG